MIKKTFLAIALFSSAVATLSARSNSSEPVDTRSQALKPNPLNQAELQLSGKTWTIVNRTNQSITFSGDRTASVSIGSFRGSATWRATEPRGGMRAVQEDGRAFLGAYEITVGRYTIVGNFYSVNNGSKQEFREFQNWGPEKETLLLAAN